MFTPKTTPLDEELFRIRLHSPLATGHNEDSEYVEYTGKAITLGLGPVFNLLPVGRYCIAGGIIRSLFNNELPNDVDIFLLGTPDNITSRLEDIAIAHGTESRKVKIKYEDFNKHIQLVDIRLPDMKYNIQFIAQWFVKDDGKKDIIFKHAEDVISYFDIVPVCYAVEIEIFENTRGGVKDWAVNKVVTHPLLYKSLANKELSVNPYGPLILKKMRADRFYKYITEYGFKIKDAAQMKLFNTLLAQGGLDVEFEYN